MKASRIILIIVFTAFSMNAHALCNGRMLNPVTDVRWNCMLPITIGGVSIGSSGDSAATAADQMVGAKSPVCICEDPLPRVGITFGMNEVTRFVETTKDPFCIASLGISLTDTGGLYGGSGETSPVRDAGGVTYFQTHYGVFLPFAAMNLFNDILCLQDSSGWSEAIGLAYMSEIEGVADGSSNSTMAALLTPEVVLFANPVAQMYCMGDAVLTAFEMIDIIGYWCAGGHSIFPLSNFTTQGVDYVDSASITAAKVVFKMTRLGLLPVCMGNQALCGCFPAPVWNKMAYRFQLAMPVPDRLCRRIGKPFLLWGEAPYKNPPYISNADNFVWLLWRRRDCCAL